MDKQKRAAIISARIEAIIHHSQSLEKELQLTKISNVTGHSYNALRNNIYELDRSCDPLLPPGIDVDAGDLPTYIELCMLLSSLLCIMDRL